MQTIIDQLKPIGVDNENVWQALSLVPREAFLAKDQSAMAYSDCRVAVPGDRYLWPLSECGQLLQALAVQDHERVICLGGNVGYLPAVLAEMAVEVTVVEPEESFAERIRQVYVDMGYDINVVHQAVYPDGWQGQYDVCLALGAVVEVPKAWWSMVAPRGRLAAIVGHPPAQQAQVFNSARQGRSLFETQHPWLAGAQPKRFVF